MNDENRFIWLDGKILKIEDAKINVLSPTSQFGANVFEGIRCYWNDEHKQLYAFRLKEHYKRLKNSVKMFRFEDKYSVEEMQKGLTDVIKANKYKEDIAVRQTIFLDGFGTWSAKGPVNMFIAPIKKARREINANSIKCCVSSWERISDRNISPKVKVGANYINSRMAQMEALENGYDSAIFMNAAGKISEGPGSCFFIIRDNKIYTPPLSASILESITRDTVIQIAKDIGIEVIERDIDRTELYICDEAFLCGSAMEISPVYSIDGIPVNNKEMTLSKKLLQFYLDVTSGKIKKYSDWLTPIYQERDNV